MRDYPSNNPSDQTDDEGQLRPIYPSVPSQPYEGQAGPLGEDQRNHDRGDALDSDDPDEPILLTPERVLEVLARGEIEEQGLLPYSSNYSFLVFVDDGEIQLPAVYKPRRGENPLWDFPTGTLCQRETAAFAVSNALGWDLVPPTVLREGTRGIGSVQFYIDCDPEIHYFTMREDARYADTFRRMVLFDFVINNADRKSGHCLFGYDERVWAIDHGICFHQEYKLRTVIWEFSNEPIGDDLLADLVKLQQALARPQSDLSRCLGSLLAPREQAALCARLRQLIQSHRYPAPLPYQRNHPWPPI
jgi:uncharacterized repeat protein (TIGR03843 family)